MDQTPHPDDATTGNKKMPLPVLNADETYIGLIGNAAGEAYHLILLPGANVDALHEARAQVLETADRIFMQMSVELKDTLLRYAYNAARDVLKKEAAAHRARKSK